LTTTLKKAEKMQETKREKLAEKTRMFYEQENAAKKGS
jgi:hypothetical protein